ncbi:hypothetical protein H8356DRAFT_1639924, partial [Neocallimastix lanati (nom. inval.)]
MIHLTSRVFYLYYVFIYVYNMSILNSIIQINYIIKFILIFYYYLFYYIITIY